MQASDAALADTASRPPDDADPRPASDLRLQRVLKIVVVALALLIVAGLAAVIWRVIYLASPSATQPAASAVAVPAEQSLALPAGAHVRSISLSGNRLAVHYESARGTGIAVLDLHTGRMVADVAVRPGDQGGGAAAP